MMKIELENVLPREIEKRSFELITEELGERTFPEEQEPIIKRCIHTSADFDYADNLCFSEGVVDKEDFYGQFGETCRKSKRSDPKRSLHCNRYADGKIRDQ